MRAIETSINSKNKVNIMTLAPIKQPGLQIKKSILKLKKSMAH